MISDDTVGIIVKDVGEFIDIGLFVEIDGFFEDTSSCDESGFPKRSKAFERDLCTRSLRLIAAIGLRLRVKNPRIE